MIIIARKYGQTCNRLFQYAHFYAYCREHNIKLFNPTFRDLRKYFGVQDKNSERAHILSVLYYLPKMLLCLITGKFLNINSEEKNIKAQEILKNGDHLVWGWGFRNHRNFVKHADEIKQYFAINTDLVKKTSLEFESRRKEFDIAVGVHIRRGDYKIWAEGRYYYENDSYVSFMKKMAELFPQKRILFVVCSNENLDEKKYSDFETKNRKLWFPRQDFINELFLLSRCDWIIGPPSTYSHWASFYGSAPCLHLISKEQNINLSEFKVCEG